MTAYYNEIDPFAASWLRELINQNLIAPGDVDERSIEDVTPADILGYTQCHFFAGIGVWSHALRLAGWPDDRPVWTGSCPCQPFSAAGQGKGFADERHLWPAFFHLIEVCGPERVFGEQVAGKDGLGWLDLVSTDLEAVGYACGAVPFPAAGIGAPHIRERLFFGAFRRDALGFIRERLADHYGDGWSEAGGGFTATGDDGAFGDGTAGRVADIEGGGWGEERAVGRGNGARDETQGRAAGSADGIDAGRVGDGQRARLEGLGGDGDRGGEPGRIDQIPNRPAAATGAAGGVADMRGIGRIRGRAGQEGSEPGTVERSDGLRPSGRQSRTRPLHNFWADADWLFCRDERWRPVEPIDERMAYGVSIALDPSIIGVVDASTSERIAAEAMRAMREGYDPAAIWAEVGGCVGFPAASVLLAVLCQHTGELGQVQHRWPTSGEKDRIARHLQQVWLKFGSLAGPPSGRGFSEQLARQLGNALPKLPRKGAPPKWRALTMLTAGPLAENVSARVGRLRGYGNAIVAQQAQAFIESYLEVRCA